MIDFCILGSGISGSTIANLLFEDLPPGPLALSKTLTEYFLDNKFAIVEPEMPDPKIQKSIISQLRICIFH